MPSGNPVLRNKAFEGLPVAGERMTMNGTVARTALLLALAVITGGWTWQRFAEVAADGGLNAALAAVSPFMWGGLLVGLVLALVTTFVQRWAGITAPLYAIAEGFALGGVSAVMLLAYRSGWIKVTDKFRMGVVAATGGIALLYLVDIGLRAFTQIQIPFIHETGAIGIGFSLLVVGLAALNLVLDFDMIDRAASQGAPKYMEWYGAFALMVTLVWLYMELLRLLSKARR